jgi:hypothetical protein
MNAFVCIVLLIFTFITLTSLARGDESANSSNTSLHHQLNTSSPTGSLAPNKRELITRYGTKALIAGTLVASLSASIMGMIM